MRGLREKTTAPLVVTEQFKTEHPFDANDFWVKLDRLTDISDLINSASAPTMSLGVESRREILPDVKDALSLLLLGDSPEHPELRRAIDSGYMYGSILVGNPELSGQRADSAREFFHKKITPLFADAIVESAQRTIAETQTNLLFMLLRNAEVAMTGSDILAYSLASAQDHISNLYYKDLSADSKATSEYLLRAQTLFYAGMLTGSILAADRERLAVQKQKMVPVLRSPLTAVERVSMVAEADAGDDLSQRLSYDFSHAGMISVGAMKKGRKTENVFGVMARPLQFGPNKISYALSISGVSEPDAIFPASCIDYVITHEEVDSNEHHLTFGRPDAALQTLDRDNRSKIIAIGAEDRIISSYHPQHAIFHQMRNLIQSQTGIGELVFSEHTDFTETIQERNDRSIKRALTYAAIGGMILAWNPEIERFILNGSVEVGWYNASQALAADAVVALAMRSLWKGYKRVRSGGDMARTQIHIGKQETVAYLAD
jgi:hypothetical protein